MNKSKKKSDDSEDEEKLRTMHRQQKTSLVAYRIFQSGFESYNFTWCAPCSTAVRIDTYVNGNYLNFFLFAMIFASDSTVIGT